MSSKVLIIGGLAAFALYESGMLEALLNPPDETYDDEIDENNLDINNPFALLAISLATRAGLKGAAKAASKAVKARNPPKPSKIPTKVNTSIKPVMPSTKVPKPPPVPVKAPVPAAAATKAASNATTKAATTATQAATTTTKAATPAAKSAAKAAKGSQLMSKLKGTPADLIVMALAQILNAILDLDPDAFKPCDNGEFDLGLLPDWAQAMIGAVPFLGDLFDLLGNKLCLKAGCPKDTEDSGGLCYPACKPGFKSDGAIMCYKQYPDFENNGMGHTITSITKKILLDTGKIPDSCGDDEEKSGLLCYEKAPDGWHNILGMLHQTCPPGFTDTGTRCELVKDVGVGRIPPLNPCENGLRDDGTSCWEDWRGLGGGDCKGGNCNTWWDGCCSRGLFNECYGCARTHCEPITCSPVVDKGGCGCIKQTAFDRQKTEAWEEKIAGLNYNKCEEGWYRVPGAPTLCSKSFDKQPARILAPRGAKCPKKAPPAGVNPTPGAEERDTEIAGLCYSAIPSGYSRKLLGTLDQDCPAGSSDFGVGCTREAYNRGAGLIPLGIRVKDRK
jgi:hypothetical protein